MFDLDDPRTEKIAEMLSNKSAKKILEVLAEKEMRVLKLQKQSMI